MGIIKTRCAKPNHAVVLTRRLVCCGLSAVDIGTQNKRRKQITLTNDNEHAETKNKTNATKHNGGEWERSRPRQHRMKYKQNNIDPDVLCDTNFIKIVKIQKPNILPFQN